MNAIFLTSYIALPIIAYKVLRLSRIRLFDVSVPGVFFAYYLAIAYVGIIGLYFDFTYYEYIDPRDKLGILTVYCYSALTLLLIVTGYFLASRCVGSKRAATWHEPKPLSALSMNIVYVFMAICAVVLIYYVNSFSHTALGDSLAGDAAEAEVMRSQMANDYQGIGRAYYFSVFFSSLLPFCTYVAFGQALVTRRKFYWLATLVGVPLAVYGAIANTEKAPVLWLMIGLFLVYSYHRGGRIKAQIALVILLVASCLIGVMATFFIGLEGRTIWELAGWTFSRIFAGGIVPAYFYLEAFPRYIDFLWGRSFPNPGGLFPWPHFRLTTEMSTYMKTGPIDLDTVSSAPTAFWAELYANFGPMAPFIVAPIFGVLLYGLHIALGRLKANPLKAALIVWCSVHYMKLAESSMSNYLLDTDLVLVLLVSGICLLANSYSRKGKVYTVNRLRSTV